MHAFSSPYLFYPIPRHPLWLGAELNFSKPNHVSGSWFFTRPGLMVPRIEGSITCCERLGSICGIKCPSDQFLRKRRGGLGWGGKKFAVLSLSLPLSLHHTIITHTRTHSLALTRSLCLCLSPWVHVCLCGDFDCIHLPSLLAPIHPTLSPSHIHIHIHAPTDTQICTRILPLLLTADRQTGGH